MIRVLFDCDGLFLNFTELYLSVVKEKLGLSYTEQDVKEWDVGDAIGLTRKQKDIVHEELNKPGKGLEIKPYPGAVEAMTGLLHMCDGYFVTSPLHTNPTWVHDRMKVIGELFGEEYADKVITTKKKAPVFGHMLIDDKPQNIDEWSKAWPMGMAILWNLPCNENVKGRYLRAGDWATIKQMISLASSTAANKLAPHLVAGP